MDLSFIDIDRGQRLKEERRRIGIIQVKAAMIADVKEQTWVRYEKRGEPFDLKVVQLLEAHGFDMIYVIFNVRKSSICVEPEQQELLRLYSNVKPDQQEGLLILARTFAMAHSIA